METLYQRIFEYSPDALLVVDPTGCITLVNAQAETLFGYDRNELIGLPVEKLVPPRFVARHASHRAGYEADAHSRPMGAAVELSALRKDGSEFPVDIMLSPMFMKGHSLTLCVVRDITERKAAADKLRQQADELQKLHVALKAQADRDSLTGLFNRRAFHELASQMLRSAHRRKESTALLMIDLDHFKRVNDRFGHAEGDTVLKRVADALKATARENDIVARHGGEEFVMAIQGIDDAESLVAAERVRAAIAAIRGTQSGITASIGVAAYRPEPHKRDVTQILERMLDQADQALYAAKHDGRNQVRHYNSLQPSASPAGETP